MICGRNRDTTYVQTEKRNPGNTSSVTAAPPRTWRRSRTSTLRPARARYAEAVRPLWPPPITMASYFIPEMADGEGLMADAAADDRDHSPQLRVSLRRTRVC